MISQQGHLKLLEQSIVEGNLEPNDQISVAKAVYGRSFHLCHLAVHIFIQLKPIVCLHLFSNVINIL
jgi:hypothetical protein